MTSMVIESDAVAPFHVHSRMPPVRDMGSEIPRGAAWSSEIASRRFDFPEPLGPISTFRGFSGRSIPSGPKDNNPESLRV